jgi:hypothetical protein
MKIVVIGGTGLIWHEDRRHSASGRPPGDAAAPNSGVNTVTGEELKEALAGVQAVIGLTNSPSLEEKAALERSSRAAAAIVARRRPQPAFRTVSR